MSVGTYFKTRAFDYAEPVAPAQAVDPPGGRLGELAAAESPGRRRVAAAIATLVLIGWFATIYCFWAPAHGGIDQNGYLVGGRVMLKQYPPGQMPVDPYSFVGGMWIKTDNSFQMYMPKYPAGLPLLYAAALALGGTRCGDVLAWSLDYGANHPAWLVAAAVIFLLSWIKLREWARRWWWLDHPLTTTILSSTITALVLAVAVHQVVDPGVRFHIAGAGAGVYLALLLSPIFMTLGLWAVYLLARIFLSSFGALLTMLVLAFSPITLSLAGNPNSHASSFFFVAWGMYLLFRWWQDGGLGRAAMAGFLIGYAVTIRYTEGLLVIPVILVGLMNLRWRDRRSWTQVGMLWAWWAIPGLFLLLFNLAFMGSITGYDPTNESTGFGLHFFRLNWEYMLGHLYNTGLFFLLPLSAGGLALMFNWNWRAALALSAWVFPTLVAYTAYYWAPDNQGVGYMRFFLTILPPLAMAGFWLILRLTPAPSRRGFVPIIATAIVAAIFSVVCVGAMLFAINDYRWTAAHASMEAPPNRNHGGSVVQLVTPDDKARLADDWGYTKPLLLWRYGLPVAVVLAGWLALRRWKIGAAGNSPTALAAALLCAISAGGGLYMTVPELENSARQQYGLATATDTLAEEAHIPAGSIILCANDSMLHHLQFVGDYRLYDLNVFNGHGDDRARRDRTNPADPNQPQVMQAERADYMLQLQQRYDQHGPHYNLGLLCGYMIETGLKSPAHDSAPTRVFLLAPVNEADRLKGTEPFVHFQWVKRAQWNEATTPLPLPVRRQMMWLGDQNRGGQGGQVFNQKSPSPTVWELMELLPKNQLPAWIPPEPYGHAQPARAPPPVAHFAVATSNPTTRP